MEGLNCLYSNGSNGKYIEFHLFFFFSSSKSPREGEAETKLIGLNNVEVTKPAKQTKDADR